MYQVKKLKYRSEFSCWSIGCNFWISWNCSFLVEEKCRILQFKVTVRTFRGGIKLTKQTLRKFLFWIGVTFIGIGVLPSLAEVYQYLDIMQREVTQVLLIVIGGIFFSISSYLRKNKKNDERWCNKG